MDAATHRAPSFIDPGSFQIEADELSSRDPLGYHEYRDALSRAAVRTGVDEAVVTGPATIDGHEIELASFAFSFLGGSMGEVAGERLARCLERAARRRVPMVLRTETGGARMQEGMRSLIQMAKVTAARLTLAEAKQPLIAVLGHPTTGGVLASLAASADLIVAEQGATIGFAGPRVAARFTGEELPRGSHTAESALEHGLIDAVLAPEEVRPWLHLLISTLAPDTPEPVEEPASSSERRFSADEALAAVRDPSRPRGRGLVKAATSGLVELRGDHSGHDDPAVITALTRLAGRRCMLVALDGNLSPGPSGYRKARRALGVAEVLGLPVVTLVDTRGADPSALSEAGGIAWEISRLFERMLRTEVPILSIVTGEGGSGGALAFATADRLVIYEDATFSVIAPEGASEILWKDADRAGEAARLLRLTAHDLRDFGIADAVAAAPLEADSLRALVAYHLDVMAQQDQGELALDRQGRWRNTW